MIMVTVKAQSSFKEDLWESGMLLYKLSFPKETQKENSATAQLLLFSSLLGGGGEAQSGSDINPAQIKFGRKSAIVKADLLEDVTENWWICVLKPEQYGQTTSKLN